MLVPSAATTVFVMQEPDLGMGVTANEVPLANAGTIAYVTLPALDAWLDRVTR